MCKLFSTFLIFFILQSPIAFCQIWSSIPIDFDYDPWCFYNDSSGGMLYIGGSFEQLDGEPVYGIIAFNGTDWDTLRSDAFCFPVTVMEKFQGNLYIGGFGGLMIYDGISIQKIPCDGQIRALYEYQGKLIVGGLYSLIGGDSLNTLAAWDGATWSEFNGTQQYFHGQLNGISAIKEFQGELYIAGNIYGNGNLQEIMKWNGSAWTDAGGGINAGGSAWINDLELFQGELYVSGYFFEQNNGPGNCIAKWNGYEWSRVGEGVGIGQASDLLVFEDKLYVSGQFDNAGGVPASYIAHWDGSSWCSFGGQIDNATSSMTEFAGSLYVCGGFLRMNGDSIKYLAKWTGGNHVDSCIYVPVGIPEIEEAPLPSLSPNPTKNTFSLTLPKSSPTGQVKIQDLQGKTILPESIYHQGGAQIDVSMLPSGLYFVQVKIRDKTEVIKLVKQN